MKCVILAGGKGNTLWPLSRKKYPKQFINIREGRSLLQDTIVRNLPFAEEFIIVTNEIYSEILETQLKVFQGLRYRIIYESESRGTFAAVSLASLFVNPSELMMVTVSDLVIGMGDYKDTIIKAKEIAKKSVIANIVGDNDHIGIYICMAGTFNETVENIYTDFDFHMRKNIKRRLRTVKRAIHVSDLVMKQFPVKSIQMDFLMQAKM